MDGLCPCGRIVLLVAIMFSWCGSIQGQEGNSNWAQFRGPGGLGVSSDKGVPTTWGDDKNLVWKAELPGAGMSSPIVFGDRVYLTCYTGYNVPGQAGGSMEDLRLHLLCYGRKKGNLLWKKTIQPELPEQKRIREEHGYATSTPVADKNRVYVFFGKTGVFAFDHDGKQSWKADVGSKVSGWGSAASPVLFEDLVIVNASVESGSLVALDKKTGKQKWKVGGIREAWNTPLLTKSAKGRPELIVPIFRKVLSFDPRTGERLWWCDTKINWYMVPSVVAHEGIVYCIGGRTNRALAIRTGGKCDVTQTHVLWSRGKGSNVTSPVLYKGHLYWMNDQTGTAYCAEAKSGKVLYEKDIPRVGQVYSSPVLAGGNVYYFDRSGKALVIAAQPEFKLVSVNTFQNRGRLDASPAVAGGQLFVRSNRHLYCIGE